MNRYGDTFLLTPFREFYAEVIRLKHMVGGGVWVSPSDLHSEADAEDLKTGTGTWIYFPDTIAGTSAETELGAKTNVWVTTPAPPVPPPPPEAGHKGNGKKIPLDYGEQTPDADYLRMSTFVWQRLVALFERQTTNAWRYGGTNGAEIYREAQYVMVALADEIFLHTEWEGKKVWVSNLLETKIFQSHVAGELFFQKLDRLLQERDPAQRDLAAVYLMALSLGFKGKYRGFDDRGQIALYRQQLFLFLFRRETDLASESKHIFPEAYYHTLREETTKRLANPRIWLAVLGLVMLTYLIASHGLWMSLTSRLNDVNNQIAIIVNSLEKKR